MALIPFICMHHCSLLTMVQTYYFDKGIALRPPILFGRQRSYGIRCLHAALCCCESLQKSFTQFFCSQVAMWWNSLPSTLFDVASAFSSGLFNYFINLTWLFSFMVVLYVQYSGCVCSCMYECVIYVVVCGYVL